MEQNQVQGTLENQQEKTILEEEDAQSVLSFDDDSTFSESSASSDSSDTMAENNDQLLKSSDQEDGEIAENDGETDKEDATFEDGGNEEGLTSGPLKTKNELEILPPIIPFDINTLPKDAQFAKVGHVSACVGEQIIIQTSTSGEEIVLDNDTVLFILTKFSADLLDSNEALKDDPEMAPLGRIWDIFGPVNQPLYSIRYSNENDAKKVFKKTTKDQHVFCVPDLSKVVMTKPLKELKGTDASNIYDEEVSEDEIEFSDDEKEQEYKKSLKRKKTSNDRQNSNKKFNIDSNNLSMINKNQPIHEHVIPQDRRVIHRNPSMKPVNQSSEVQLPYPEFNQRQANRYKGENEPLKQINPYLPPAEQSSISFHMPLSNRTQIQEAQQKQIQQLASLLQGFK